MSDECIVQYLGFLVNESVREYTFSVRDSARELLHYKLTITNEAFVAHRARYQDAPAICRLRLNRELDSHSNHPPTDHFSVTDQELADFQDTHKPGTDRKSRKLSQV